MRWMLDLINHCFKINLKNIAIQILPTEWLPAKPELLQKLAAEAQLSLV